TEQFFSRTFRCLRQHRHADQPVGCGRAEFHQPVVVNTVAGDAQHWVVGRDLKDRTKDDLALDAIAIHIGEPQFGNGRAARALIEDAATVEGVVDRLWPRPLFITKLLADPAAPHLTVANPHRLTIALFDARSAVAQLRWQPSRPQIRW